MIDQMNLVEKVGITTGTGWQMGLCVGNTGMLTSKPTSIRESPPGAFPTWLDYDSVLFLPLRELLIPNHRECRLCWLPIFMPPRWTAWSQIRR